MIEIRVRKGTHLRKDKKWIDISGHLIYALNLTTLAGADLSGLNLDHADLTGHDLAKCVLRSASLGVAKLDAANLSNAVLVGTMLGGASLRNAILVGNTFAKTGGKSMNE